MKDHAHDFARHYAKRLLKRVEKRLRRSAQNRERREYAQGYRIAANALHKLTE